MTMGAERREVAARFAFEVAEPTDCELAIRLADGIPRESESLEVRLDGVAQPWREFDDEIGGRLLCFRSAPGRLEVDYAATVTARAHPAGATPLQLSRALRPSRYAPSDRLVDLARAEFAAGTGERLAHEVAAWVSARLDYVPEASDPLHGAVETLERGAGVCRDYAHLTAALLRARDVPARVVAVYAPQLSPPDFHAVVEAWTGERWIVVDATRLAPRRSMLRITTGRDAADTAWATTTVADVALTRLEVTASSDIDREDDPDEVVELS